MITAGLIKPELLEYLVGDEEEVTTPRDQIDYLKNRISKFLFW